MLSSLVAAAAERFGPAPVFVDPDGRPLSYQDLHRRSGQVAAGLAAAGLGRGAVLGLALPASVEYALAYVGAARLGAVTAGVNPRLTAAEQDKLLGVVGPDLVLRTPADVSALEAVGAPPPAPPADDPERLVAIVFTSGTTGTPKGAMFTNAQLAAITAADVGDAWGGGGPGVSSTSLAHVGFMTKLPGHLRRGGCSYLLERWTADDALRLVSTHRMANFGGVPTQVALMLRHPDFDRYDLSCVRSVVLGAGPAHLALLREARDRIGAPISIRYSCTETGGCGTATAFEDPIDETLGVGRPRGPVQLSIRSDDGRPVADGDVGEICIASPTAMAGYYENPSATAAAFWPDGYVRTGDLGRLDTDGRVHLAGRSKEMYVRGGYNVFPLEVEEVLLDHPAVAAIAVVAVADEVMGERGVAVVVPRDPAAPPSLDDLRSSAAGRLSSYKLPDELRVVDALPLTAGDKLDRRALAAAVTQLPRR
jgi:acyl-CoA synthetase (AMP-forming)/AMP-acid ligase II